MLRNFDKSQNHNKITVKPSENAELIVAALNASSIVILQRMHPKCMTNGIEKHGTFGL